LASLTHDFLTERRLSGQKFFHARPALKSISHYGLTFALDDTTTEALVASASRLIASSNSQENICDLYYESSKKKVRSKNKSARRRYRVRRVDSAEEVNLESLSWEQDLCSRQQTIVPSSELTHLQSASVDPSWSGKWFHKKLVKHALVPSLELHFDRILWKSDVIDGEICLTVDTNIQASFPSTAVLSANLVRMNFSVCLPSLFKALVYEFALLPEQPSVLLELARAAAPSEADEATSPFSLQRSTGLVASSTTEYA
jgi:hypothetical protein